MIGKTPIPPYYAVIFTSERTDSNEGYQQTANLMVELAQKQPGYIGHESAHDVVGITIYYWDRLEVIKNWKKRTEHFTAQTMGRKQWYSSYKTRICKVERDYDFHKYPSHLR